MKRQSALLFLSFFFSKNIFCQLKFEETFYTANWQITAAPDDARFYSITKYTDSGWNRSDYYLLYNGKKLQMSGLYEDKENTLRNGVFKWFYAYGGLKTIGQYIHNKKEGIWYDFFENGDLQDSLNYKNGEPAGISISWFANGFQRDSLNMDDDGNGTYLAWFDNGAPSQAGRYISFDKKNGKWQYFNKNGNLTETEIYNAGNIISKKYFNNDGTLSQDTTSHDGDAIFPGGDKAWSKYIGRSLRFPEAYTLQRTASVIVIVSGTIDENGNVVSAEVVVPFHPEFDKSVKDAILHSPVWQPAIEHNRPVYYTFRQSVNFNQSYY